MKKLLWQLYLALVVCGLLIAILGAALVMGGCQPMKKPAPPQSPPGEYMPYSNEYNPAEERSVP